MPQIKNAADARGEWASGSDFGPGPRKGFGRTEDVTVDGPQFGLSASSPSLRAITDAFLQGQIELSPDNPYRQYVQEYVKSFAGRGASNFAELARAALGHAVNDALDYDASSARARRMFGGRPHYIRDTAPFDGSGLGAATPRYLQGG